MLSVALMVTIFLRYISTESFPLSAYFVIGAAYIIAFGQIGILATDLSYSFYFRETPGSDDEYEIFHADMFILWNILYWGNLVVGTVFTKFF